ncbi:glutathione S-transferase family protein [Sphingosinicella microcystinivorans]|uniref:glutathione S-transferase family protein n=1 Tax=Sphingosinicella microcystinivorans TaxID=335406 RepID=UPI0022F3BC09|nr:glutathione S-transferase family protein [Sphingosinicella microcystinivorans]WBX84719.1 glutathione S-transferase family protein [Sphingosinicella microcystinivorans]
MIRVYGATLSPFVRKVVVALAEKGLDYELVPVSLQSRNPDFLSISPFGKMPAFRDGDFALSDSSAIIHYLDAKYPERRLIPQTPEDLGRAVWFDEFGDTIVALSGGKVFFNRVVAPRFLKQAGSEETVQQGIAELPRLFDYLEGVVPEPGGFLVGGALSLADIAVASPFVNLSHCAVDVDCAKHPRLGAWLPTILSRPSFAGPIAAEKAMLAA